MTQHISTIVHRWKRFLNPVLLALALGGCVGLPDVSERVPSAALAGNHNTRLARSVQSAVAEHPGLTGSHLLQSGEDGFAARIVLADVAERSLDIQYYVWKDDLTGKVLTERLLSAADRGVRVRLLLDDLGSYLDDPELLALNSHPNLEVRLFNPVVQRSPKLVGKLLELGRINRRMHNKSFTADGQVTILGGRNIGDEYFAADQEMNFSDLDVALIGPAVKDVSSAFDLYWNNQSTIGISELANGGTPEMDLAALRIELAAHEREVKEGPYSERVRESVLAGQLKNRVP